MHNITTMLKVYRVGTDAIDVTAKYKFSKKKLVIQKNFK